MSSNDYSLKELLKIPYDVHQENAITQKNKPELGLERFLTDRFTYNRKVDQISSQVQRVSNEQNSALLNS